MDKFKQFLSDLAEFIPRIFRVSWEYLKWDWEHRREKNNRAKRRRRENEVERTYREK